MNKPKYRIYYLKHDPENAAYCIQVTKCRIVKAWRYTEGKPSIEKRIKNPLIRNVFDKLG